MDLFRRPLNFHPEGLFGLQTLHADPGRSGVGGSANGCCHLYRCYNLDRLLDVIYEERSEWVALDLNSKLIGQYLISVPTGLKSDHSIFLLSPDFSHLSLREQEPMRKAASSTATAAWYWPAASSSWPTTCGKSLGKYNIVVRSSLLSDFRTPR
ncbi:hypothetical protein EVAR_103564_1 [Eumeta japonica]|uniref:Uncharacterized protein n=1 Tax=Eumeta variegata TaxID=151549 RepID=A0A4C1YI47_EUMVA|nr:hypothetical protein EVAR_103564_1 [Eumeta japonica]